LTRLEGFAGLLGKWQRSINLVAAGTLPDIWRRHMLDSAALFPLIPSGARTLVDLGSGAGFPGLVLAILGVPEVHLIDSDARKCAFLTEAARHFASGTKVHRGRIETITPIPADVLTARALAELEDLLGYGKRFLKPGGVCLFLKGSRAEDELTRARQRWRMVAEAFPNPADSSGKILRIKDLSL
jgi:16S rRNA (guanine527-N7)-methyltransferase